MSGAIDGLRERAYSILHAGPLTISELASNLVISEGFVARLLAPLTLGGLVRLKWQMGQRGVYEVTEKGQRLLMAKYAYHRLDANHAEIVDALRKVGASVDERSPVDLLVGFRGQNFLLEVKTKTGKLGQKQMKFFMTWQGQARVVLTVDEALQAIGAV